MLTIKHVELIFLLQDLKLVDSVFAKTVSDGYNEKRYLPEIEDIYDKLSKFFWKR